MINIGKYNLSMLENTFLNNYHYFHNLILTVTVEVDTREKLILTYTVRVVDLKDILKYFYYTK